MATAFRLAWGHSRAAPLHTHTAYITLRAHDCMPARTALHDRMHGQTQVHTRACGAAAINATRNGISLRCPISCWQHVPFGAGANGVDGVGVCDLGAWWVRAMRELQSHSWSHVWSHFWTTCRGGICGACVARVAKGSTDMSDIPDLEFTVSEEEQAKGMTLLCMARATSDCEIEIQSDWGYSLGNEWKGATGAFEAKPVPMDPTKAQ
eukprot:365813-Chlamydomonas_euryale.AAC.6